MISYFETKGVKYFQGYIQTLGAYITGAQLRKFLKWLKTGEGCYVFKYKTGRKEYTKRFAIFRVGKMIVINSLEYSAKRTINSLEKILKTYEAKQICKSTST